MEFAVSSLGFPKGSVREMENLPREFGVEIFYERGGPEFWEAVLPKLLKDRTGPFSIHGPFGYVDFASDLPDEKLYCLLREPFDLYHRFGARHLVVHTNLDAFAEEPEAEREHRRQHAARRLTEFSRICREEGISLLVENVTFHGRALFSQEQFLALFQRAPELRCLLDLGHAHVEHFEIPEVIRILGHRIQAFHVHNNDGILDSHSPLSADIPGGIDWNAFRKAAAAHAPGAELILEYKTGEIERYVRDRELLSGAEGKVEGRKQ